MKEVLLPNAERMWERLLLVDDIDQKRKYFYPLLVKRAGEKKSPEAVIMILTNAILDYCDSLNLPKMANAMLGQVPRYLEALIEDKKCLDVALASLQK